MSSLMERCLKVVRFMRLYSDQRRPWGQGCVDDAAVDVQGDLSFTDRSYNGNSFHPSASTPDLSSATKCKISEMVAGKTEEVPH